MYKLISKFSNLRAKLKQMDKTFHTRIGWYNYLYLAILGIAIFCFLWYKLAIIAVLLMIFLIVLIERIIHTTYTVTTDGKLVLKFGRFIKSRTIRISTIRKIKKIKTMKISNFYVISYVLVECDQGYVAVTPIKEKEFVCLLLNENPGIVISR